MEEHEREKDGLNARIKQLEADIERCNRIVFACSTKCRSLEAELREGGHVWETGEKTKPPVKKMQYGSDDIVPLPSKSQRLTPASYETRASSQHFEQYETNFGCGKCRIDTKCECIEEAFDMQDATAEDASQPFNGPCSPAPPTGHTRSSHGSNGRSSEDDHNEIDFTARFTAKQPPVLTNSSRSMSQTTAAPESCGFCQDGTACICAELAVEEQNNKRRKIAAASAMPRQSFEETPRPCINGPGTCAQCRSDANSTLFCKSLAATRALPTLQKHPMVGGDLDKSSVSENKPNNTAITGVTLSCADAYTTLSRHPAYGRATEDMGSWMPSLASVPTSASTRANMTAFEIEAADILRTLRDFDNRFGSER